MFGRLNVCRSADRIIRGPPQSSNNWQSPDDDRCNREFTTGVCEPQRIPPHIPKPIPPTLKPNRISTGVPPHARIIKPVEVVEQPIAIIHLPRVAQSEADGGQASRRQALSRQIPKRTVGPLPARPVTRIGQAPWRVQVIAVHRKPLPINDGDHRHRAAGGGQVDVFGAAGGQG